MKKYDAIWWRHIFSLSSGLMFTEIVKVKVTIFLKNSKKKKTYKIGCLLLINSSSMNKLALQNSNFTTYSSARVDKFGMITVDTCRDVTEGFTLSKYYLTVNQMVWNSKKVILFVSKCLFKLCELSILYLLFNSPHTLKDNVLYYWDVNRSFKVVFVNFFRVQETRRNYTWSS